MRLFTQQDLRLFTQQDQEKLDRLQHERDAAFESAQRVIEANLKIADDVNRLTEANLRMAAEIVRLAQRHVPVVPEGEVEQPKSLRDNDRVVLEDPDRQIRPQPPRPQRVE